jgi:hypothetical protein
MGKVITQNPSELKDIHPFVFRALYPTWGKFSPENYFLPFPLSFLTSINYPFLVSVKAQ